MIAVLTKVGAVFTQCFIEHDGGEFIERFRKEIRSQLGIY